MTKGEKMKVILKMKLDGPEVSNLIPRDANSIDTITCFD